MRRLRGAALVTALAAVLAAVGCSPAATPDPDVVVSGEPGVAPTITYVTPVVVGDTFTDQVWPGSGPDLVEGGPVLIDFWLENGENAELVKESYSSNPTPRMLTEEALGTDLYRALKGQKVGARVLQVSPANETTPGSYPTVTVLDVLPTRAAGEAVPPRADLPVVSLDDTGAPTITATGTAAPTDLVTQALIRGTGQQVGEQDTITVQYSGFAWDTGELFDSTWSRTLPVSFSLQDVPAWSDGLVEQPVGSQVMLVIPPSYPLGVTESEELAGKTVVFVIDILATGAPDGADS
ncbi:FKBP-type peptidyl-prolyl cis-trans isomerase [Cellulomonas soli]|uniref:FKBP-type peptidyl-prolyl cis-trans isomerase n=1 Tax=Cellulomonas soli TaxID=931535 RepID=UPI003F857EFF